MLNSNYSQHRVLSTKTQDMWYNEREDELDFVEVEYEEEIVFNN